MPMRKEDYPPDWDAIAYRVKLRADFRCEWPGCDAINVHDHPVTGAFVVLAACHVCDCTPKCGNEDHLLSLCQLHHLQLDAEQHVRTRAINHRKALVAAGQLGFFAEATGDECSTLNLDSTASTPLVREVGA